MMAIQILTDREAATAVSTVTVPLGAIGSSELPPLGWADPTARRREQWRPHLEILHSWCLSPTQLADDEVEPPTPEVIALAIGVVESMIAHDEPAPTHTVPTVDGGIAFERRTGDTLQVIEIDPDGEIEALLFQYSRLIERIPLS